MAVCKYCEGDLYDYVSYLPKMKKGFNAFVCTVGHFGQPHIVVTAPRGYGEFAINYCPMCGKKLIKE